MKKMLVLIAALLAGCATTVGKPLEQDKIAALEKGVTTEGKAREYFGNPVTVARSSDGSKTVYWTHTKLQSFSGKADIESIAITFGSDGFLTNYMHTTLP